jgi:hypothetical protein
MEHMRNDAVDCGIAAAALLVGHAASITEAGEHEAVRNALDFVLVAGLPGQRADRAGNEQKAIAIARPQCLEWRASVIATAIPERLSFASEGWQIWHENSTVSSLSPRDER